MTWINDPSEEVANVEEAKHVKQLIASCRALNSRNEKNFHKEFIAGLALFAKSTASGIAKKEIFIDRRPYRLFSLSHSIQWCLAKRIQMALPSLPKPMDLKPIFDDLAYCSVKPDLATQKGIAALAEE